MNAPDVEQPVKAEDSYLRPDGTFILAEAFRVRYGHQPSLLASTFLNQIELQQKIRSRQVLAVVLSGAFIFDVTEGGRK